MRKEFYKCALILFIGLINCKLSFAQSTDLFISGPNTSCISAVDSYNIDLFNDANCTQSLFYNWSLSNPSIGSIDDPNAQEINIDWNSNGTVTLSVSLYCSESGGDLMVEGDFVGAGSLTISIISVTGVSISGNDQICGGSSTLLSSDFTSSNTFTPRYTWFRNLSEISGANNSTYPATNGGDYAVKVSWGDVSEDQCNALSFPFPVTNNTDIPNPLTITASTNEFCEGGSAILEAPSPPAGATFFYQWVKNDELVTHEGESFQSIEVFGSGDYHVNITSGVCQVKSNTQTIEELGNPPPFTIHGGDGACLNTTRNYTIDPNPDMDRVVWSPTTGSGFALGQTANGLNTQISYTETGTYNFTLTPYNIDCPGTAQTFTVVVEEVIPKVTGTTLDHNSLFNSTEDNSITLNTCSDRNSLCDNMLNGVKLFASFSLGDDYELGESEVSANLSFRLEALDSDNVTIWSDDVDMLLNSSVPEQLYLAELTSGVNEIRNLKVVPVTYNTSVEVNTSTIKLDVYYEEMLEVDVRNVELTLQSPLFTLNQWEQRFEWDTSGDICSNVPGYEFQLIRIYAGESPEWGNALSILIEDDIRFVEVSMAEGTGNYRWRVRAIGSYQGGIANPLNWGPWNEYATSIAYTHPEDDINWIYKRNFTEGGKISEQLTYANGLQQVQQVQTKIQSDGQVVATQSIQDYVGRTAASSLPVPVKDKAELGYQEMLLKNGLTSYSANHFDENPFSPFTAEVAGAYYSGTDQGINDGVPSAEGFPYTRTYYTNDETGRVLEQSGVGATHAMNSNKTIKTFYSGVPEGEIVSLFGQESPEATDVRKITTVDANNVASVSYQDSEGKVLATALSIGSSTGSMDELPSQASATKVIFENIIGDVQTGPHSSSTQKPLLFTQPTVITVNYSITPEAVDAFCAVACRSCDYRIDFILHNNNPRGGSTPEVLLESLEIDMGNDCSISTQAIPSFDVSLDANTNYVLEKRITSRRVNPATGVTFRDEYISEAFDIYSTGVDSEIAGLKDILNDETKTIKDFYAELENRGYPFDASLNEYTITVGSGECEEDIIVPFQDPCAEDLVTDANCKVLVDDTPLDFEEYFEHVWAGKSYVTPVDGKLQYLYFQHPEASGLQIEFAEGQFNAMMDNMLTDNGDIITCEEIWPIWIEEVDGYDGYEEIIANEDLTLDGDVTVEDEDGNVLETFDFTFSNDLFARFMNRIGSYLDERKVEDAGLCELVDGKRTFINKDILYGSLDDEDGSGNPVTTKVTPDLSIAYKLAYYDNYDQDGSISSFREFLAYAINPTGSGDDAVLQSDFSTLDECQRQEYYRLSQFSDFEGGEFDNSRGGSDDIDLRALIATILCKKNCTRREDEFLQALIHAIFTDNPAAVIEHYRVDFNDFTKKYTGVMDLSANDGIPVDYTECEIEAMADALVANCKEGYCDLTIEFDDNGHLVLFGTPEERARALQVLNYEIEVDVVEIGENCGTDWDYVDYTTLLSYEQPLMDDAAATDQYFASNSTRYVHDDESTVGPVDIKAVWYAMDLSELVKKEGESTGKGYGNDYETAIASTQQNFISLSNPIIGHQDYISKNESLEKSFIEPNNIQSRDHIPNSVTSFDVQQEVERISISSVESYVINSEESSKEGTEQLMSEGQVPDAIEVAALKALYESTNGENWTKNWGWPATETEWLAVTSVSQITGWFGVLQESGDIQELDFFANNLFGTIPYEIGHLSSLELLYLQSNQLSGELPAEIGDLSQLTELDISNNNISGNVLSLIVDLNNLEVFISRNNPLTGIIPPEIGNLSKLRWLDIHNSQLSGTLPAELGNIQALEYLSLSRNILTGPIPSSIGNLQSLKDLTLFENQLSGSTPAELGNLTSLEKLDLRDNNLTGIIPASFGNLLNLSVLILGENQWSGNIPDEIGNLVNLRLLDISSGRITRGNIVGSIPVSFGNLSNLENFSCRYNQLSGSLPVELSNISNLESIDVRDNNITGSIPEQYASLSNFEYLNIRNNQISGLLPIRLSAEQPNVYFLDIDGNNFNFGDLEEVEALNRFQYNPQNTVLGSRSGISLQIGESFTLDLNTPGNNNQYVWQKFDGSDWVDVNAASANSSLTILATSSDFGDYRCRVTNTELPQLTLFSRPIVVTEGTSCGIANDFLEIQALKSLFENTNGAEWTNNTGWPATAAEWDAINSVEQISGWYGVTTFECDILHLNLNSNGLVGSIPDEIGDLGQLRILDLSANTLSNSIPESIGDIGNSLEILRFGYNELSGPIPERINDLTSLEVLDLSSNQLDGPIPEICNLVQLQGLLLNSNELSGNITSCIGSFAGLGILSLYENNLNGQLPSTLGSLTNLTQLLLNDNSFEGSIPESFSDLNNLLFFTVGNNNLNGSIPVGLGTQNPQLQILATENNFYEFGDLESLSALSQYSYNPQKTVLGTPQSVTIMEGESGLLTLITSGEENEYTWQKWNGSDYIDELGQPSSATFTISNAAQGDAGLYRVKVTNEELPGLVLYSHDYTVSVNSVSCGIANDALEIAALRALYEDTNGDEWVDKTNWPATPAEWDDITSVSQIFGWHGITHDGCDITEIELFENGLNGALPPEIGDLVNLRSLWMHTNQISGSFSAIIENLYSTNVEQVNFLDNLLQGNIPSNIENLSNLRYLNAFGNLIEGSIPPSVGLLSSLEFFDLGANNLTGAIPDQVGNLLNLQEFLVSRNNLNGEIPDGLGNLINLLELDLSRNNITGSLPGSISNLVSLRNLDLSRNLISGELPTGLSNLINLRKLYLNRNSISGMISPEIGSMLELTDLDLSDNDLEGTIPSSLSNLSNLLEFNIEFNVEIHGEIPLARSGGGQNLTDVIVRNNKFSFGDLEGLSVSQNFSYNPQFTVLGSPEFLEITEGQSINLDLTTSGVNNEYRWQKFNGSGWDYVSTKSASSGFSIASAAVNDAGTYRVEVTNTELPLLTLYSYDYTLTVNPASCGMVDDAVEIAALRAIFEKMDGLNWPDNTGWPRTPAEWDAVSSVADIELTGWHGVGTDFCDILTLGNSADGGVLVFPEHLNVSIPEEIGDLSALIHLYLSGQGLSGPIPAFLGNMASLQILGLYESQLSGPVPDFIGDLTNLKALLLYENNLSGTIPSSLGNLVNINDQFWLYGNNLTGSLPPELNQLTQVEQFNVSNNNLVGEIPIGRPGDNSQPTRLYVYDNYYEFGDLEGHSATSYSYSPQKTKLGIPQTINVNEGEEITLELTTSGANNLYQWAKIPGGFLGQPSTNSTFVIPSASPEDAGQYGCYVTNTELVNLTLTSHPYTVTVTPASSCGATNDALEIAALKTLYESTDGPNWTNNTGWPATDAEWGSITAVSQISGWHGIAHDGCEVKDLLLNSNNLNGTLPAQVSDLQGVTKFYMASNNLSGSIPGSIGTMGNLQHLRLSGNNLSGSIPTGLGSATQLRTLSLEGNSLSGSIPSDIGSLPQLITLLLQDNLLDDPIPASLSSLGEIRFLDISGNQFSGNIPVGLIGQMQSLQDLIVDDNQFDFGDLEGRTGSVSYIYSPQNVTLGSPQSITISEGQSLSMSLATPGTNNLYTWQKWNGSAYIPVRPASSSPNFLQPGTGSGDAGMYRVEVTNTELTALTLYSHTYNVTVIPGGGGSCGSGDDALEIAALRALYENTSGSEWTNNTGWPATAAQWDAVNLVSQISGWYGVTHDDCDITSIRLDANNLSGSIPNNLTDLSALQELDLFNNQLSGSIPVGINAQSPVLDVLSVGDNQYNFGDLENHTASFSYVYAPQNVTLGTPESHTVTHGQDLDLTLITPGTNNRYIWQKWNGSQYVDIPSQTPSSSSVYTLNNIKFSDAGTYRAKVTNTELNALTLYSFGIVVNVQAPVNETCFTKAMCFRFTGPVTIGIPDDFPYVYEPNETCDDIKKDIVLENIEAQESNVLVRYEAKLSAQYDNNCGPVDQLNDNFNISYETGLHHYTLYYYDRSGNLMKTVPPAGVSPLDVSSASALSAAKGALPAHTLETNYEYNSLGQLSHQETPDAGETSFWYDAVGQLRFSQNAQQVVEGTYSYTKYDRLGRIIEVGQSDGFTTSEELDSKVDDVNYPETGSQITRTVYSDEVSGLPSALPAGKTQEYLRNRVSYTYLDEDGNDATFEDRAYTVYSYDPHGNVEWLVNYLPELEPKCIDYEYDLLSGNVTMVKYNQGASDEFYHKYEYDADNRITAVYTSKQGKLWDREASYEYYAHGPLKRTVIGEDRVQGMDYTYTIHGWLKGVNHSAMDPNIDPGKDGLATTGTAKDAFGMVLNYYDGDYTRSGLNFGPGSPEYLSASSGRSLYNGNISSWAGTVTQEFTDGSRMEQHNGRAFAYDQLNRITQSDFYRHDGTNWVPSDEYDATYSYDPNGNLQSLKRNGDFIRGIEMDDFTYHYNPAKPNQLEYVSEASGDYEANYENDLDGQGAGNYSYDEIGNLTSDVEGEVSSITWTVYGKPKQITKTDGSYTEFIYDAGGNRVMKRQVQTDGNEVVQYYIRDASGNIMAVYKKDSEVLPVEPALIEIPIYGSDRLGTYEAPVETRPEDIPAGFDNPSGDLMISSYTGSVIYDNGASVKLLPGFEYESTAGEEFVLRQRLDGQYMVEDQPGYESRFLNTRKYELKDHLGNVRAVVGDRKLPQDQVNFGDGIDFHPSIKAYYSYYPFGFEMPLLGQETFVYDATFETDSIEKERMLFPNYDEAYRSDLNHFNATEAAGATYSERLNGKGDEIIGLAKSLEVKAGDYITASVFGKYAEIPMNNDPTNLVAVFGSAFNGAFQFPATAEGDALRDLFNELFMNGPLFAGDGSADNTDKALLNYLLFDESYALVQSGFIPLSPNALQNDPAIPVEHELLSAVIEPVQDGYLYVYLSNESTGDIEVYFDDFRIVHTTGAPDRTPMAAYRYGFNGKEKDSNGEWGLNHYDYGFRIYNPAIGRFLSVDPLTDEYPFYSPYHFAGNNPISFVDLDGMEPSVVELYWKKTPKLQEWASEKFGKGAENRTFSIAEGRYDQGEILVFKDENTSKYFWYDKSVNQWSQFLPIQVKADEVRDIALTSIAVSGSVIAGAVLIEAAGALIVEEGVEYLIEEATGIPIIMDPIDLIEQGFKKLLRKQVKDKLSKKYGKEVIDGPGSYTITYKDGSKYHGKGNLEEAISGAHRKSDGDEVTNLDWTPSKSNIDGFKDEAKRLNKDGGHKSNTNRNQRDSPGNRKYKDD